MKAYDGTHTIDQLVRDLQIKVKDGLYNVYLKTVSEEDRKLVTFEDFCNIYIVDELEYSSKKGVWKMNVRIKTPEEIMFE